MFIAFMTLVKLLIQRTRVWGFCHMQIFEIHIQAPLVYAKSFFYHIRES